MEYGVIILRVIKLCNDYIQYKLHCYGNHENGVLFTSYFGLDAGVTDSRRVDAGEERLGSGVSGRLNVKHGVWINVGHDDDDDDEIFRLLLLFCCHKLARVMDENGPRATFN